MFGVKDEVVDNKFSVPKSETFPAEFIRLLEKHKLRSIQQQSRLWHQGFHKFFKAKRGCQTSVREV